MLVRNVIKYMPKRYCRKCGQQIKGRKGGIGKCEKCLAEENKKVATNLIKNKTMIDLKLEDTETPVADEPKDGEEDEE